MSLVYGGVALEEKEPWKSGLREIPLWAREHEKGKKIPTALDSFETCLNRDWRIGGFYVKLNIQNRRDYDRTAKG